MSDLYVMVDEKQSHVAKSVKEYGQELLGFIRKRVKSDADAEDILQDVWYQLSAVINVQPIEQVGAWLYKVARNKIIDKKRKKSEVMLDPLPHDGDEEGIDPLEFLLLADDTPETVYESNMVWEQLFLALDELPAEQRDVFIWHELDHLPFAEIAEITGVPVATLVSRKRYAVLHLRKRLQFLYNEMINK